MVDLAHIWILWKVVKGLFLKGFPIGDIFSAWRTVSIIGRYRMIEVGYCKCLLEDLHHPLKESCKNVSDTKVFLTIWKRLKKKPNTGKYQYLIAGKVIEGMWLLVDSWAELSNQRLLIPTCPWNVASVCLPHSQKLTQGQSLEIVMWGWKHVVSIWDWNKVRPLYKLSRFGRWVQRSIHLAAA